ncbi:MAG: peptide deformylase [Candidatus Dormibacter sp.]|uniref:peptide deformylase n=1 Tax=Candidatus Dormibacter sp. TaxID=2973982 RepID=UPI003D9B7D10
MRQVLTYPHPILLEECAAPAADQVAGLVVDLLDTMRSLPRCWGLAAPQIGEPARVALVDVSRHPAAEAHNGLLLLINPVILDRAGKEVGREGCQSLPGVLADVRRARRIHLRLGAEEKWCSGIEARAVQHELDHLDGILILDRIASAHALHFRG